MRLIISVIIILMIESCSAIKPTAVGYDCPIIELPPDPSFSIKKINDKSTPDEVIKFWVANATAYREWDRIVRKEIESSS